MFPGPDGALIKADHFRKQLWYKALKAEAVDLFNAKPWRPGFHDLRRGFATRMHREGVDLKTATALMGQADPRLMIAVYAQEEAAANAAALDLVAARYFGD